MKSSLFSQHVTTTQSPKHTIRTTHAPKLGTTRLRIFPFHQPISKMISPPSTPPHE